MNLVRFVVLLAAPDTLTLPAYENVRPLPRANDLFAHYAVAARAWISPAH